MAVFQRFDRDNSNECVATSCSEKCQMIWNQWRNDDTVQNVQIQNSTNGEMVWFPCSWRLCLCERLWTCHSLMPQDAAELASILNWLGFAWSRDRMKAVLKEAIEKSEIWKSQKILVFSYKQSKDHVARCGKSMQTEWRIRWRGTGLCLKIGIPKSYWWFIIFPIQRKTCGPPLILGQPLACCWRYDDIYIYNNISLHPLIFLIFLSYPHCIPRYFIG